MQFISEYTAPQETLEGIYSYLDKCEAPFQDSKLYDSTREEKFVDKSLRLSEFRELKDDEIFSLSEHLVDVVNAKEREEERGRVFSLVRNDVTHIKYRKGGFFRRHADFLSLTSNMIEEYTLILCVTPPDLAKETRGGETIVHTNEEAAPSLSSLSSLSSPSSLSSSNPSASHRSTATTTPGRFLVFRKDMDHEGAILVEGEKHILTLNLWCTSSSKEDVLLVTFPKEKDEVEREREERELGAGVDSSEEEREERRKESQLHSLSQSTFSRTYVIPVSKLRHFPDSLLASYVWFDQMESENSGARDRRGKEKVERERERETNTNNHTPSTSRSRSRGVITFECFNATFASFSVIYRIIMGMYISPEEVKENSFLITYFNLPATHILVTFSSKELERERIIESLKEIDEKKEKEKEKEKGKEREKEKEKEREIDTVTFISGDDVEEEDLIDFDADAPSDGASEGDKITIPFEEIPSEMPSSLAVRRLRKQKKERERDNVDSDDVTVKEDVGLDDLSLSPSLSPSFSPSNPNIIVCATSQRTKVVASLARDLGLPYIPFRIYFAEGAVQYGGGMSGKEPDTFPMRPLWVSMGSYDNILFYEHIMTKRDFEDIEERDRYESFLGDRIFQEREKGRDRWSKKVLCEITADDCKRRKEKRNHRWRMMRDNSFDDIGNIAPYRDRDGLLVVPDGTFDHVPIVGYTHSSEERMVAGRLRFAIDPKEYTPKTIKEREEEERNVERQILEREREMEELLKSEDEKKKREAEYLSYFIKSMKTVIHDKTLKEEKTPKKWRGFRRQVMDCTLHNGDRTSLVPIETVFVTLPDDLEKEREREREKCEEEVEEKREEKGERERKRTTMQSQFKSKYFHFDSSGSSCFTLEEAEATTEWAQQVDFPELVRQTLNDTPFELPQVCTTRVCVVVGKGRGGREGNGVVFYPSLSLFLSLSLFISLSLFLSLSLSLSSAFSLLMCASTLRLSFSHTLSFFFYLFFFLYRCSNRLVLSVNTFSAMNLFT